MSLLPLMVVVCTLVIPMRHMDVFYSMTFWMDLNSLLVACKQLEFKLWAFAMDLEASFTMKSDECFVVC